jgi:hypothetical protein
VIFSAFYVFTSRCLVTDANVFASVLTSKSKLNYYRRSVGQSASVSAILLGPMTNLLPSERFWFVDMRRPLWTREQVCSLQLLLGLASAVFLGSESRGTYCRILQSLIWDSPNLGAEVPVFTFSRNRVVQLYFQALRRSYVKVKVILRPTASRPVHLGVRHQSGTRDQFFPFSLWLFLDSCWFVDVGLPLWREVGSVVFRSYVQGQGQGYITTNNQSVSISWYRAQSRTIDQSLLSPWNLI